MSKTESRDAFCNLTEQYLSRAITLASYCSAESQRVEKPLCFLLNVATHTANDLSAAAMGQYPTLRLHQG